MGIFANIQNINLIPLNYSTTSRLIERLRADDPHDVLAAALDRQDSETGGQDSIYSVTLFI